MQEVVRKILFIPTALQQGIIEESAESLNLRLALAKVLLRAHCSQWVVEGWHMEKASVIVLAVLNALAFLGVSAIAFGWIGPSKGLDETFRAGAYDCLRNGRHDCNVTPSPPKECGKLTAPQA
ncbi:MULTISPECIES: hypothetical protein [Agrobacterium]|uniref:Uncharacterized protein n=1 Tax=Agrobacterium tumefaciens TaxID=358 RepID=A0AAE6BGM0_AGRTU|nr:MULTISPECIES: hypothetical protein [Agrobacterium]QCL76882.1 hypothetical protein CFBP5499_25710 [Agrobacterium tumefaciens]QCL82388.1 hypothetical protein CFBP5877_24960 [Agrobacterium tumefaciens]